MRLRLLLAFLLALAVPASAFRGGRRVNARTAGAPLRVWHGDQQGAGLEGVQAARLEALDLLQRAKETAGRAVATAVLVGSLLLLTNPGAALAAAPSGGDAAVATRPSASTTASRRRMRTGSKAPVIVEDAPQVATPALAETGAPAATPVAVESDVEKSRKLTQMGLALVAINVVALLFTGDDPTPPPPRKKRTDGGGSAQLAAGLRRPAPAAPVPPVTAVAKKAALPKLPAVPKSSSAGDDDLFDIPAASAAGSVTRKQSFASGRGSSSGAKSLLPPSADDLFDDDETVDNVVELGSRASAAAPAQTKNMVSKLIPQPASSSSSSSSSFTKAAPPAATLPPPSPPPPPPAKKNLLDRLFQKPGGGRPTDLTAALGSGDGPAHDFRVMVANALAVYVPGSVFPSLAAASGRLRDGGEAAQAEELRIAKDDSGLSEQDAAVAFAEVANAMLVSAVDAAVAALQKDKEGGSALTALEHVTDFISGAGNVYAQTVPGAVIEPVVYNGKAKKGDLETLYLAYLRETMNMESILSAAGLSGAAGGGEGAADPEAAAAAAAASAADTEAKMERLGKLQVVFNIKEGKRSSLEQKAMREMFMGMAKGEGGLGDLGGMLEALQGKGGGAGGMPDMAAFNEMMAAGGGGGGPGMGMPDIDKMDPAEMQAASAEAVKSLKAALKDGSVTRKDVEELEKMMGVDVKQIVKMMDSGQVDKSKLQELGSDVAELMDVFKELAKIK